MSNLYLVFRELMPEPPTRVGTVLSSNGGVHYIQLVTGGYVYATGTASIGTKVFVKGGVVQGVAPDLADWGNIEI